MQQSKPLTIYKASAGSGKTFQLALYYVTLILSKRTEDGSRRILYYPGPEPKIYREILAITFTNKATEEMKSRIVKVLKELADLSSSSAYRAELLKNIDTDAQTLAKAASRTLTSLLYDFGELNISTIDSFFQRVLRSFAYEADLMGNYELSIDDERMNEMAIAETLAMAANLNTGFKKTDKYRQKVRNWIHTFLKERIKEGKDFTLFDCNSQIRSDLRGFIKDLTGESFQNHSKNIEAFFQRSESSIEDLKKELILKQQALLNEIVSGAHKLCQEDWSTLHGGKTSSRAGFLTQWDNGNLAVNDTVKKRIKSLDFNSLFTKNTPDSLRDLFVNELTFLHRDVIPQYLTVSEMLNNIHNLGLFSEVIRMARDMKVQMNTIMLSDTNSLLNRIIGDSPTPFIYERIGQRLQHFLIDEFQDTSLLQWENLEPLLNESLGNGKDNLVIGDVKQSIYRFRNAEPGLLDHELENRLSQYVDTPPLDVNFRSSHIIVEFNSRFFKSLAKTKGFDKTTYANVSQKAKKIDLPGYVSIALAPKDKSYSLNRMVDEMRRQLDSGYSPRDIAVLVETNREGAEIVEYLLAETGVGGRLQGVKVLSDEALFVRNSRAVQYIVNRLKELSRLRREETDTASAGKKERVITTEREIEWLQLTLQELNKNGCTSEESLEKALQLFDQNNRRAPIDLKSDKEWRESCRSRSLFDIVESIIRELPDKQWLVDDAIYISAFQDIVLDFSRNYAPSVNNFLRSWTETFEAGAAVGLAAGVDAIRVITIHKSKGLEFPCVHIPLLNRQMVKEDKIRWYDAQQAFCALGLSTIKLEVYPIRSTKKLECTSFDAQYLKNCREALLDSINLLYVAFTRAVNELIISCPQSSEKEERTAKIFQELLPLEFGKEFVDDDSMSYWTFGNPTFKAPEPSPEPQKSDKEQVEVISIDSYDSYGRKNAWACTEIAELPEDENFIR